MSDETTAGLQSERTSLSWARTALTASVAALAVTRYGVVRDDPPLTLSGLVLLVAAAGVGLAARSRHQGIERSLAAGRSPANRAALLAMTAMVGLAGLTALWAIASAS